jgi:RimJ/RimL family protein N-acetyltransferase
VLKSERLVLRELLDSDFEAVHAYAADLDVVRYMEWGPNSEAETRQFLGCAQSHASKNPRIVFELAVVDTQTDRLIGSIGLHTKGTQAMLGFCFSRSAWGQGYATEAARLLVDFGFRSLGVHRIWAESDPENAASLRVLEKLGMRREGHFRHDCQVRGEWRDTVVYAILEDEWKGHSA